jgi:hypothetical protein
MGLEERVAILETKLETAVEKLDSIEEHTAAIRDSMSKQRGFMAGMLAILTPIWGAILYMGKELFDGFLSK